MAAGQDLGRVLGSRAVADAGVPLRFLLPISTRIFVALGSGDRKLRHAPAVLSSGGAWILSGVSRESDAIDIHKSFSFLEWNLGLRPATPARPARSGVARVKPRGIANLWKAVERTKRSKGLQKR